MGEEYWYTRPEDKVFRAWDRSAFIKACDKRFSNLQRKTRSLPQKALLHRLFNRPKPLTKKDSKILFDVVKFFFIKWRLNCPDEEFIDNPLIRKKLRLSWLAIRLLSAFLNVGNGKIAVRQRFSAALSKAFFASGFCDKQSSGDFANWIVEFMIDENLLEAATTQKEGESQIPVISVTENGRQFCSKAPSWMSTSVTPKPTIYFQRNKAANVTLFDGCGRNRHILLVQKMEFDVLIAFFSNDGIPSKHSPKAADVCKCANLIFDFRDTGSRRSAERLIAAKLSRIAWKVNKHLKQNPRYKGAFKNLQGIGSKNRKFNFILRPLPHSAEKTKRNTVPSR